MLLGGCGPADLLGDGAFNLWCGDELCSWKVEQGRAERVSTWHRADFAASLEGNPVVLTQLVNATSEPDQDTGGLLSEVSCIRFDVVADHADNANLTLEVDFGNNGSFEYSHPLTSDEWNPVSYTITPPEHFEGANFRVRKAGIGRAVLASLQARSTSKRECTDPPLPSGG